MAEGSLKERPKERDPFGDKSFPCFVLNPSCSLKYIEYPCIYDKERDNLFRINEDTLNFLMKHQSIPKSSVTSPEMEKFLRFLFSEGLLLNSRKKVRERKFLVEEKYRPAIPSLRYLLVHLTLRCNLRCRHCYADASPQNSTDIPFSMINSIFNQMEEMQGLIVLLSGGEPLCYPHFWKMNDILPSYNLRFEILSNGTMINKNAAKRLNVHHVQVSIDGMEKSHDFMRGRGSFKKAIEGIENLIGADMEVSVSTMIHKKNVNEFDDIERMIEGYGINQWIINQPSVFGRWKDNSRLSVSLETAADIMRRYSRARGPHESKTNFTCGSHICTVLTDGKVFPCPFLNENDMLMGTIRDTGLRKAWKNRKGISIADLEECSSCEFLEKCRGGCRFRAKEYGNVCGRDPVVCSVYNKSLNKLNVNIKKK